MKTTGRFVKSNGSFSSNVWMHKSTHQKQSSSKSENIYNSPFSRVRARAHHRSFCIFAVTSVTDHIVTYYISINYDFFEGILTNVLYKPAQHHRKYHRKHLEKTPFRVYLLLNFAVSFLPIFPIV